MAKKKTWNDEKLLSAVKTSFSVAEVCRKLNLKGGSSHSVIKQRIKELGLDTNHFTGPGWNKGKTALDDPRIKAKNLETAFQKNSTASSSYIKKLCKQHNLIPYVCECGNKGEWRGKKLTLHLDHINGDNKDNTLENLRFLCPNCHSQTHTYCGRNKTRVKNGKTVEDEDLILALKRHASIRQALMSLGLSGGGNYKRAKNLIEKFEIRV